MTVQMTPAAPDGDAVAARRRKLGLSREALSFASGGVSISTIRRIERGIGTANRSTLTALAVVLGADLFPIVEMAQKAVARRSGAPR
jgi:transcriptional regulator with XRE-family HTH domain